MSNYLSLILMVRDGVIHLLFFFGRWLVLLFLGHLLWLLGERRSFLGARNDIVYSQQQNGRLYYCTKLELIVEKHIYIK